MADNPNEVTFACVFFDPATPQDQVFKLTALWPDFNRTMQDFQASFAEILRGRFNRYFAPEEIMFFRPRGQEDSDKIVPGSGWTASKADDFIRSFIEIPVGSIPGKTLLWWVKDQLHLVFCTRTDYERLMHKNTRSEDLRLSMAGESKSSEYTRTQGIPLETIHDGYSPLTDASPTTALPIKMFHPVFDQFIQLIESKTSAKPTIDDIRTAKEFLAFTTLLGMPEKERNTEFTRRLQSVLKPHRIVNSLENEDGSSPDGACVVELSSGVEIPTLIIELECLLGDSGLDPSIQVGKSMRNAWLQPKRQEILNKACCPTLLIASGGAWLGVLGAVFTDRIIVQRLTDLMLVGQSEFEEDLRTYRLALVFMALRSCLTDLERFYRRLDEDKTIPPQVSLKQRHPRFFPYPTSFVEHGTVVHFKYLEPMSEYSQSVTYKARIVNYPDDCAKRDIVVKFVTKYGLEAHQFLSGLGHAPGLRYYGPLSGENNLLTSEPSINTPTTASPSFPGLALVSTRQMVIMDFIKAGPTPSNAHQQVSDVVKILHDNGYVFGDLRSSNVLFDMSNKKVKFVHFDWSGRYHRGEPESESSSDMEQYAHYPLNLSMRILWPEGVEVLAPIRPAHDLAMLNRIEFE
ncbi:hypothetical protein M413DRAFT_26774 [Hebeloma cylindrosporum]|uniref:Protein kinase domain-containing protein n=1 Tax=Hebeloma cylindrosporum TaxID=76867 RepID=A0A0C3CF02_HEBCY|nr:hypothetical protein M413DRAFT_26774 [Hebeloma cylindrosporum h7]